MRQVILLLYQEQERKLTTPTGPKQRNTKVVKRTWYGGKRIIEVPASPPAYTEGDEKTDIESGEWAEELDSSRPFPLLIQRGGRKY